MGKDRKGICGEAWTDAQCRYQVHRKRIRGVEYTYRGFTTIRPLNVEYVSMTLMCAVKKNNEQKGYRWIHELAFIQEVATILGFGLSPKLSLSDYR